MSLPLLCGLCLGGPAEDVSIDEVFSALSAQFHNLRSLEIRSVVTTDTPASRGKPLRKRTPEEQQSFEKLPKRFQEYLMKIAHDGSIERNEMHFRFEGDKFAVSTEGKTWAGSFDELENASLLTENSAAYAFNGKQYQLSQPAGFMRVSSKETFASQHPRNPYFLEAFRFVRTAKTPGKVSLDWLRKEETWEQLKQYAVMYPYNARTTISLC